MRIVVHHEDVSMSMFLWRKYGRRTTGGAKRDRKSLPEWASCSSRVPLPLYRVMKFHQTFTAQGQNAAICPIVSYYWHDSEERTAAKSLL
jgi:hypothetical protein